MPYHILDGVLLPLTASAYVAFRTRCASDVTIRSVNLTAWAESNEEEIGISPRF